ncbi:hypothetical protein [Actomonas aquatica]|uniref:TonB C-terminal domain-containing protein n=1 Tax=Actomonas aquatica TaxID=2866162 RepID=A0ABZ1C735_9BACT|nr:hypothetical protein [Opitutus sp. WL0086]WRQ87321.1 hypothetical protein K1X11_021110 [Opitutus sp. WL0086]
MPRPRLLAIGATLTVLTGLVAPAPLHAAKPVRVVSSAAAPVRDHHLFVGVESFLPHERELLAVRRFEGAESVLETETGEEVVVERDHSFRFKMTPKVSPIVIKIDRIRGEETYSAWTDPKGQWMSRQMALSGHYDDQTTNATRVLNAGMNAAHMISRVEEGNGGPLPGASVTAESTMNKAISDYQQVQSSLQAFNDSPSITDNFDPLEEGDESVPFDAINLRFNVRSPEPIADAHALARVRVRTPDEGYKDFSFQRDLGALDRSERSILLTLDGLPPGFEFVDAEIHLFNHGEELATTQSERLMPLTAAEARQYVMLDYLAQHRDATLPPSAAWSLAPAALRAANDAASVNFAAKVEVNERGEPTAIHALDGQILPESMREIFGQLTYLPALAEGQPVAGTVIVHLADYFR